MKKIDIATKIYSENVTAPRNVLIEKFVQAGISASTAAVYYAVLSKGNKKEKSKKITVKEQPVGITDREVDLTAHKQVVREDVHGSIENEVNINDVPLFIRKSWEKHHNVKVTE